MAYLGLIDFKNGSCIIVNVNTGKNNFKSISNKLAKMTINWQK